MAIDNPFVITYSSNVTSPAAGEQVGGTSDIYLLKGPYVIDKSFETLRLVFDVVVIGTTYANLQARSDSLEVAFRKRDVDLLIDIDGTTWTYTSGTDILNTRATLAKTGDPETDRGYSRAYTCTVEGDLPADDDSAAAGSVTGLREIEWTVDFESGRQRIVSARGIYTATKTPDRKATANYQHADGADTEATTFLAALSGSASYELVDETFTSDRNDHGVTFSRQYVELLANQAQGVLDDTEIRDHSIVFTDTSQHPGDSIPGVSRLRRVIGTYDCAIDIDQTTNLQTTYTNKVRPHILALFNTNFSPNIFAVENERVGYDETSKRILVELQIIYQSSDGGVIVEISQSKAYRESRTIDYTPVHNGDELAYEADPGWATVERIQSRTVVVVGLIPPRRRIGVTEDGKIVEPFSFSVGGGQGTQGKTIRSSGWNLIENTSQTTQRHVGDPANDDQIVLTVLTETVVERLHNSTSPARRGLFTLPS